MPNHVRFFSIMADDVARARKFYETLFGWTKGLALPMGELGGIEKRIAPAGGTITMPRMRIETVGELLYLDDPEGNRVGVMQYDEAYDAQRER